MARATEWRRGYVEFEGDVLETGMTVQITSLGLGETLTRVRYSWQASATPEFGAEAVGIVVGVGIIALPPDTPPEDMPGPLTDPDLDWIAYEHSFFSPHTVYNGDDPTPFELDLAPSNPGERDTKAQRLAGPDGQDIWLITQVDSTQGLAFWSAGWSCLVLLPA